MTIVRGKALRPTKVEQGGAGRQHSTRPQKGSFVLGAWGGQGQARGLREARPVKSAKALAKADPSAKDGMARSWTARPPSIEGRRPIGSVESTSQTQLAPRFPSMLLDPVESVRVRRSPTPRVMVQIACLFGLGRLCKEPGEMK